MWTLSNIGPNRGAAKPKKRRGRGDKTAGKGTKGQNARSGGGKPPWFEGGQMPLYRRLPKKGFHNPFARIYQIVNLRQLEEKFEDGETVNRETLKARRLIHKRDVPVKILGKGTLTKKLIVEVDKLSEAAKEAILRAGGEVK